MSRKFLNITRSISDAITLDYYKDIGIVEFIENDKLDTIQIKVIPHEGFHINEPYFLKLYFSNLEQEIYPYIYIDSIHFDKIKTNQYLKNQGVDGIHKGICIKYLCYGYGFKQNFKKYCNDKWENYLYNLIVVFNNLEDFDKGLGFKSNFREILKIS